MLKNALLAVVSLAFTWLVLELVVAPLALPLTPLRIHAGLPRPIRPLAQSSKQATIPEHYVALLGDSYAQGAGDWLLTVDSSGNPPFHSAHLLHEKIGRDVISFGASGAGSLRALGTEPEAFVDTLLRTWRYRIPDPELLLAYFYEGNDLQDNLRDLDHTYVPGGFDPARIWNGDYFRDFVRRTAPLRTPVAEELETWHWSDNFFLLRFVLRVARAAVDRSWEAAEPPRDWSPGNLNRVRVAGVEQRLPDALQAPPLELSDEELELALWAHAQGHALLRQRFAGVRTLVVYVPAPLTVYELSSPELDVEVQRGTGPSRFSRAELLERSDLVCRRIADITHAGDAEFLDLRPSLRELASTQLLHGPRDWKHFNRTGQERVADVVAAAIERRGEGACATLAQRTGGG